MSELDLVYDATCHDKIFKRLGRFRRPSYSQFAVELVKKVRRQIETKPDPVLERWLKIKLELLINDTELTSVARRQIFGARVLGRCETDG